LYGLGLDAVNGKEEDVASSAQEFVHDIVQGA